MEVNAFNILVAFAAGIVSFFSPCVLPLVPAYIGYLSGPAVMQAGSGAGAKSRSRVGVAASPVMRAAPAGVGSAVPGAVAADVGGAPGTTVKSVAAGTMDAPRRATAGRAPARRAGGAEAAAMSAGTARRIVMTHALLFVLGFSFVFVVIIGQLAGVLSEVLFENRDPIRYVMGVMLVVFGLHMLGVINIPFLNYTRRLEVKPAANLGYARSLLIGFGFGAGWTPCIGPTLGLIMTMAVSVQGGEAQAFPLFLAYSLGMGVPFLLAALAMGKVSSGLKKLSRRMYSLKIGGWTVIDQVNIVSLVGGAMLILMGILIFTNSLVLLNRLAPNFGI